MVGSNPNRNMQRLQKLISYIQTFISRDTFAIILSSLAQLLFPIAFIYPSQHKFHPILNNLQRGIAIIFSHILICTFFGISLDFPSKSDLKYLFLRNGIILIHQLFYSGMYFVVSYPIVNTITLVGPLSVYAIDYYINGVQITKFQRYGIALGIFGVLLTINADIIKGLFVENHQIDTKYHNYLVQDQLIKVLLCFIFLILNIGWGYAITMQKRIKNQSGIKISYFLGLVLTFSSGIVYSFGQMQTVSIEVFAKSLVLSGLLMSITQIMFISALRLTKYSGKLSILMFLYGIPAYLISIFRYGQHLNWISVFGFILMTFGLYKCVFNK